MKTQSIHEHGSVVAALLFCSLLASCGCDQANDLIKEAKEGVSDAMEDKTPPEATPSAAPASAPAPKPAAPKPPSPAEVLANFEKLESHAITDGALQALAASPEAAAEVKELTLNNMDGGLTGGGLQTLGSLPNLSKLKLSNSKMLPTALKNLSAAKSLTELDVTSTKVDDEVMSEISSISGLEALTLTGTSISAAVGPSLSKLSRLKSVDLSSTPADDTTVAALTALPLENMNLMKTRISNVSIQTLIKMPSLKQLNVAFTSVNGAAFKGISQSQISMLCVSETPFGIEGFAALKGAKSLEELYANRSGLLEHKAANVFRTMPKLRHLNVSSNNISDAALVVFFKGHRTLEELYIGGHKRITDDGLAALVGIKTLKLLNVTHSSVGARGATELKKRLPDCTIATSAGTF